MRVLVVKMSSLGDVIHTLPALTDAATAVPGIRFDWVVEEGFAEIPAWHSAVERVIPVALRRWRRHLGKALIYGEARRFLGSLRAQRYDRVIDAQGLIKSALVAAFSHGPRSGLDADSAREPLSARLYHQRIAVPRDQHAIERVRRLFAAALGYDYQKSLLDYGISGVFKPVQADRPYLVFLHGTTWATKHWPEAYWRQLIDLARQAGLAVKLPWGSEQEQARAQRLVATVEGAAVLPKMGLRGLAEMLRGATGVVAVDTGLGHLAAALDVPCVTLYGPTRPALTGTRGKGQHHLAAEFPCSPCLKRVCDYQGPGEVEPACFGTLRPDRVWRTLDQVLAPRHST